jgi:ubiquinone/menaquinone biosynthesis C-methylase UbiE
MDKQQIKSTLTENYNALAAAYERAVVPVFRPIAKRMIQLIDLRPGWHVLDAGTGTGLVALLGAARVGKTGKMIGVDAAEKMLELARHKAEQFGFTQCEFRVGDLEALDLPDAQFNAVLSQFALHHTDPAKAMREFARVLLPGGTLVVHEWADTADTPNKVVFDILSKYRAADAGGALALARAQSERAYNFRVKVATEAGMSELAKSAGFSDVRIQVEEHHLRLASVDAFIDYAAAAPLVFAELAALSPEVRVNFNDEVRRSLRSFETAQGFEWTYRVLSLVAQK